MVEPLRHRQTKGAATDMFYLTPPRHISTLPNSDLGGRGCEVRFTPMSRHREFDRLGPKFRGTVAQVRAWSPRPLASQQHASALRRSACHRVSKLWGMPAHSS